MKSWLKWLFTTDYKFTVKHGTDTREYEFAGGIIVVKYETKRGGVIYTSNKRMDCKSVPEMINILKNIL